MADVDGARFSRRAAEHGFERLDSAESAGATFRPTRTYTALRDVTLVTSGDLEDGGMLPREECVP